MYHNVHRETETMTLIKKCLSIYIAAILLFAGTASAQELTNAGSSINIPSGNTVTVMGAISTTGSGTITNNGTLQASGNWSHDGSLLYSGTGTLELNGSGAQDITAGTIYNLLISGSGTKITSGISTVTNGLSFSGSATLVSTSLAPVVLSSTATLSETANGYIDGWIRTTRTVAQSSANSFGGLGLTLTANGATPGSTTVLRGTGTTAVQSGTSNLGIRRVFELTPTNNTGLNADIVFAYRDGELNSLSETTLILFGSVDGGSTWSWLGQVARDPGSNTLTMSGVQSFGKLTLGSSSSPLPLTWLSFSGLAKETGNELVWTTANETNTARFDVERSADGRNFSSRGSVVSAGNSATDRSYTFLDAGANNTYFYRLKQVDLDGHFTYSTTIRMSREVLEVNILQSYPNPFSDRFRLRFGRSFNSDMPLSIILLDASGKVLLRRQLTMGSQQTEIPVSGLTALPRGSYFIKVAAGNGQQWLLNMQH
jgi:hypothetical protein